MPPFFFAQSYIRLSWRSLMGKKDAGGSDILTVTSRRQVFNFFKRNGTYRKIRISRGKELARRKRLELETFSVTTDVLQTSLHVTNV